MRKNMKNKVKGPSTDTDHIFLLFGPSRDPQAGFLVPLRTNLHLFEYLLFKHLDFNEHMLKS